MIMSFIIFAVFTLTMLTAAIKDASTMTIPNWVSLVLLVAFAVCMPFVWQGLPNFGQHIGSGLGMFALGFAMFAFGWLGGGDAKLMAATSFWWTFSDLVLYVVYTTFAGGVLALFIMVGRRYIPVRVMTAPWMHTMFRDQKKMPYGLALAFGALATLPQSDIFKYAAGLA